MWQKNVKCDVRTVQLRMKPTNVKEIKKKKTTKCDKCTVKCDVATTQC